MWIQPMQLHSAAFVSGSSGQPASCWRRTGPVRIQLCRGGSGVRGGVGRGRMRNRPGPGASQRHSVEDGPRCRLRAEDARALRRHCAPSLPAHLPPAARHSGVCARHDDWDTRRYWLAC